MNKGRDSTSLNERVKEGSGILGEGAHGGLTGGGKA